MIARTLRTPWAKAISIVAVATIGLVLSGSTLRNASPLLDMQSLRRHLSKMSIRIVPAMPDKPRHEIFDFDQDGDPVISLPVIFSPDADNRCPQGLVSFGVFTPGVVMTWRKTRAELPFSADDPADFDNRSVSFVLGAPTCRLTIKIEQEVLTDGVWTRLRPEWYLK